jgi:hypothetical protein
MDLKIKLLEVPDSGSYLIVIIRGLIEAEGFERLVRKVAESSESLLDCRVLIDLEEATLRLARRDILDLDQAVKSHLARSNLKMALVSSPETDRLQALSESLRGLGLKVAVFDDSRSAVAWLAERT